MAVLKLFRNKSNGNGSDHHPHHQSEASQSTASSKPSSGSRSSESKSKSRKGGDCPPKTITPTKSKVQMVESFLHLMSNFTTVNDLVSYFVPQGAMFIPEDVSPIPIEKFASLFQHLHEGFPDMHFTHESIHEDGTDVVVVERAQFSGNHTGTAYSPMPGKLAPIKTSGKHVVVDEERFFFDFEGDKFKSFSVVALGPMTGPMGVYEKLHQLVESE